MNVTDKDLTAYCGLFCGDCLRYRSRVPGLAADLLKALEEEDVAPYVRIKRAGAKALNHYDSMVTALAAISALKCETPCRLGGDGCDGSCEIKICVIGKALEGCWECHDFEKCNKFDFLKPFHGDAPKKNLEKVKEHGLDNWAKYREKCYPWM